ncbi:MAG: glutamate--tRNA ligase, partial [Patescibacteria group bacterium]
MTVRTRFAPSPTGHLHIGGLRTALYNFLFARRHKGQFIVRIEDTDRARLVPGALEEILDILKRAGLMYDEGPDVGGKYGPYVQSERLEIYRKYAKELAEKGAAYWCVCSAERLEKMREEQKKRGETPKYDGHCRDKKCAPDNAVLRLRVPADETITFSDVIRGDVSFASNDVDDQVLLKSDGFPTYHLANIVDDHLMKITHVIRGEEWLSSTPKHILLYEAFGWKQPAFAHLPLILSGEGGKLSKRSGHAAAMEYFEQGYLSEALVNFLALLGWNPSGAREVYALDELIKTFDLSKVNKGGAVFSMDK